MEPQARAIDAMSRVRRRPEPLAEEHMAQVAAALLAHGLGARAVRVSAGRHGARQAVPVRRPPAPGVEFLVRAVQRGAAARAVVGAPLRVMLVVGAGVGGLRGLKAQYPVLLCAGWDGMLDDHD